MVNPYESPRADESSKSTDKDRARLTGPLLLASSTLFSLVVMAVALGGLFPYGQYMTESQQLIVVALLGLLSIVSFVLGNVSFALYRRRRK